MCRGGYVIRKILNMYNILSFTRIIFIYRFHVLLFFVVLSAAPRTQQPTPLSLVRGAPHIVVDLYVYVTIPVIRRRLRPLVRRQQQVRRNFRCPLPCAGSTMHGEICGRPPPACNNNDWNNDFRFSPRRWGTQLADVPKLPTRDAARQRRKISDRLPSARVRTAGRQRRN